jgi:Skp family chaperone for outer membrane proteins
MYNINKLLAFVIIFASSLVSYADDFKLATVDINKILNELSDSKQKKAELDKKSVGMRDKITKERNNLKLIEDKLKKSKPAQDSKEVEDFRNKVRAFERLVKDSEEEMRREFLKVNKVLTDRVVGSVQAYAKENDIKVVFDKSAPGRSPVLYGVAEADITDEILRDLNG